MGQLEGDSDLAAFAKSSGLRYVSDGKPGIMRKRRGTGFSYVAADGKPVRDKTTIKRIKSLVIPPAWQQVWICPFANGHLQATGRDARGRKQSRYHPHWREVRDETKYERMLAFGKSLPAIREQVTSDLALPGLPRKKILATIVRLLEVSFIRIGNTEYAKQNQSYGLTTMRGRHVQVEGSTITFTFQGKSGVRHTVDLNDRRLANIIKRCQELPGYELFQYLDEEGEKHTIDSSDVNEYICEVSRQPFTAKDFRTWAGSVLAYMTLRQFEAFESETEAKRNVVQAIKSVASRLGNTVSVCRECYIHPAVLDSYLKGDVPAKRRESQSIAHSADDPFHDPSKGEAALMRLLQR